MEEKVVLEEDIFNKKYLIKVSKKILSVLIVFAGLLVGFRLAIFFLPFVIAIIINKLTDPFVNFMTTKLKLNRKFSIMVCILVVIALLGTIGFFTITKATSELYNLATNISVHSHEIYETGKWIIAEVERTFVKLPEPITTQYYAMLDDTMNTLTIQAKNFATILVKGVVSIPTLLIYTIITILATIFIGLDKKFIFEKFEYQLPAPLFKKIMQVARDAFSGIAAYVKSQFTIILMTFAELLIGFTILSFVGFDIKYIFAPAILIALVDSFPLLGSGTVLVPWAAFNALTGNVPFAIAILCLYLTITIVRQLVEPKIISKNLGVHPVFTLIAMYTGFKLFGFLGFILGPIIMFMLKNIYSKQLEKGFFKDIFEK